MQNLRSRPQHADMNGKANRFAYPYASPRQYFSRKFSSRINWNDVSYFIHEDKPCAKDQRTIFQSHAAFSSHQPLKPLCSIATSFPTVASRKGCHGHDDSSWNFLSRNAPHGPPSLRLYPPHPPTRDIRLFPYLPQLPFQL